jgi:methionine sulfoxide reductase catalytic subunit
LPHIPVSRLSSAVALPHGFPVWVRYAHFFNFLFLTIGARSWHFIDVYGFVVTGLIFVILLFATEQWRRLVPISWIVPAQAWSTFVLYANFRLPPEPNGFYGYNALQQLAYCAMVFVCGPLSILIGIAMSPALANRFPPYPRLFGGRQAARSILFLLLLGYVAFLTVLVTLVVVTGFTQNMNHIFLGTDDLRPLGMILGFARIAVAIACWAAAHYISWRFPRTLQHIEKGVSRPVRLATLNRLAPAQKYTKDQISPRFWSNGKRPEREDWQRLASGNFLDYRLDVGGLAERPFELSLADKERLGKTEFTTMHHCIQGWVRHRPVGRYACGGTRGSGQAETVGQNGGILFVWPRLVWRNVLRYQRLDNVLKPECLLAYEMNGAPPGKEYGAPLRLRVENQLGYKMVKWIERIEFIESEKQIGEGEGGTDEDDLYFDLLSNNLMRLPIPKLRVRIAGTNRG